MLSPDLVLKEKLSDVPTENIPESLDSLSASEEKKEKPVEKKKDLDIFLFREQEWKKSLRERMQKQSQRVQEKKTVSSVGMTKHTSLQRQLQLQDQQDYEEVRAEAEKQRIFQQNTLWKLLMTKEKKMEPEDMNQYINRKRQMFLLQYALDMKQNEIQRMELLVSQEEEQLAQAEKSLEKDAALFDEFLRDNDCSSVQALKVAEKETKAKMEKVIEIRDLTVQMMSIKSEMSKFEDMLYQYKIYKDFLYKLSPPEWQEEQKRKNLLVRKARQKNGRDNTLLTATPVLSETRPGVESRNLHQPEASGSRHLEPVLPQLPKRQSSKKVLKRFQQPQNNLSRSTSKLSQMDVVLSATTLPLLQEEESDEELELYFTEPKQLLDIFVVLEEQNLSLIQNAQEMEETLDELDFTLRNTQARMDKEIRQLKQWMESLMLSINKEEETAADLQLRSRVFYFGEYKGGQEDKLLESLNRKVLSVYKQCVGSQQESNLGTLQMLTIIEHQLHELLENLDRMSPSRLEQAEMAKDKERRQRAREEKIRQQKLQQEERLARFQARSQAEVKKKEGRRLVYRSQPLQEKVKKVSKAERVDKETEEQLFFFT